MAQELSKKATLLVATTANGIPVTKTSVFDLGYISKSDASQLPYNRSAYFSAGKDVFWELIITRLTEEHQEMYALHESLADAIIVHAAGASPVQITIEGYLPAGDDLDMRTQFLRQYINAFREFNGVGNGNTQCLKVLIRHTVFNLHIQAISFIDAVETPDFTTVSIKGVASFYNQDIGEPLTYSVAATDSNGSDAKNSSGKKKDEEAKLVKNTNSKK